MSYPARRHAIVAGADPAPLPSTLRLVFQAAGRGLTAPEIADLLRISNSGVYAALSVLRKRGLIEPAQAGAADGPNLTPHRREVLLRAREGLSPEAIADAIGVHRQSVYDVLGWLRREGLLPPAQAGSRKLPGPRPSRAGQDSKPGAQRTHGRIEIRQTGGGWALFGADGAQLVGTVYADRGKAETRAMGLERARQKRRRPCITCGNGFLSEGAHHRMCAVCRKGGRDAGVFDQDCHVTLAGAP